MRASQNLDVEARFGIGMVDLCNGSATFPGRGTIQERLADAWLNQFVHAYPPGESVPEFVRDAMAAVHDGLAGKSRADLDRFSDEDAVTWVRELRRISEELSEARLALPPDDGPEAAL